MSKMGFLQAENAEEYKIKIPKPEYHSLTIGETGAGKTVSILYNIIKQELQDAGCLIIDEKNTLHNFVKYTLGEGNYSTIYQLGNSVANGENDIGINLLQIACGSKKSRQEFFDKLVRLNDESKNSHNFWAQSASDMIQNIYMFLTKIKDFLCFIERYTTETDAVCNYAKIINILNDTGGIVKVKFKITSLPLTFRELAIYFRQKEQFIAICEKGEIIVKLIQKLFPLDAIDKLSDKELVKLNILHSEMIKASVELKKHTIPYDAFADASGVRGVYFTACIHMNNSLVNLDCLNMPKPKMNLIELLENGNHVIINSESLPNIATNIITSRTLELLTLRAKREKPPLVSFIADEASRVLNKDSDMDRILAFGREAGVRVHIATQSENQLEELFGTLKYESMKENLGDIYSLSSNKYPLKKFLYFSKKDSRVYKSVPCFIDKKILYTAEKNYQINTGQYCDIEIGQDEVIIFDARLYEEKNLLIVIDAVTLQEREVEYVKVEEDIQVYFKKTKIIDIYNTFAQE